MPRRLAVAKHARGFDSVGWTLLGFLLGASLAVFALLHADFHGLIHLGPPPTLLVPGPPPAPVVRYSAPTPAPSAPLAPPPVYQQSMAAQASAPAALQPAAPVNALASAGAASAHAAAQDARPKPAATASKAQAQSGPDDAQVDDDAAAAGMTSRAGASPAPRGGNSSELY